MRVPIGAALAVVLAMGLSACSGSADERTASEAIAASMLANGAVMQVADEKEANCVGDGFVSKVGVDKLREYGLLNEDLTSTGATASARFSEPDAKTAADVMLGCVDVRQRLLDSVSREVGEDPATMDCVDKALTDESLRGFMITLVLGDELRAQNELVTEELYACLLEAAFSQ